MGVIANLRKLLTSVSATPKHANDLTVPMTSTVITKMLMMVSPGAFYTAGH
jgi:hypothetical protein